MVVDDEVKEEVTNILKHEVEGVNSNEYITHLDELVNEVTLISPNCPPNVVASIDEVR